MDPVGQVMHAAGECVNPNWPPRWRFHLAAVWALLADIPFPLQTQTPVVGSSLPVLDYGEGWLQAGLRRVVAASSAGRMVLVVGVDSLS